MKTLVLSKSSYRQAADLLSKGEIVAFPTETVYGLGAPIFFTQSIKKIFTVKGRPQDNPLIAHIGHLDQALDLARDLPSSFYEYAEAFFPGPLTLIVKKSPRVPSIVSGGLDTVAIRMPSHPVARSLLSALGKPLVAPSANLSGRPSSTTASHVRADFDGKIAAIIDGGSCLHGIESTVLDLIHFSSPTLLRPGAIGKEVLEAALGKPVTAYRHGSNSLSSGVFPSPGMKYRHYAPKIPVDLYATFGAFKKSSANGSKAFVISNISLPITYHKLEKKSLYLLLRLAEEKGYEHIAIITEQLEDPTLLDRLEKITR